ncbi:MAG: fumarylacetoacetate hydrolase family protein, partial [Planctomycetaceae bacterium]
MRLCRYRHQNAVQFGFYRDPSIIPLAAAAREQGVRLPEMRSMLAGLPGGETRAAVVELQDRLESLPERELGRLAVSVDKVSLLVPVPDPSKLLLLAGNYSEHIEEGGGKAEERQKTFPYVFMKPPLTTLTNPGDPVCIPAVSPKHIDWELELGVIIGRRCQNVSEADALSYVAGYTVVNDISDRRFKPNPNRADRPKDDYFDWLHGKWHDTFCPMGPCVLPADNLPDPQMLRMTLRVNGEV